MKKRILSLVLCAALLLSLCLFMGAGMAGDAAATEDFVPAVNFTNAGPLLKPAQTAGPARVRAIAADNTGSGVQLNKTVTPDENSDAYTVRLEAYATGAQTTVVSTKPCDIVLVLDVSGSMDENLGSVSKTAADKELGQIEGYYYYSDRDGRYDIRYNTQTNQWEAKDKWVSTGIFSGYYDWRTCSRTTFSYSKLSALKSAVNTFIEEVAKKETDSVHHNISIVKFAGDSIGTVGNATYKEYGHEYNYSQIVTNLMDAKDNRKNLMDAVNNLKAGGATAADYGMEHAQSILNGVKRESSKVVVMFTDGEPNHDNDFDKDVANDAISAARSLKDSGATVYTVGCMSGADGTPVTNFNGVSDVNKYMHLVSSNYKNAEKMSKPGASTYPAGGKSYYLSAGNAEELKNVFQNISNQVGGSDAELTSSSVLKDAVTPYFEIPDGANAKITLKTAACTGAANGKLTFGAETAAPSTVTATVSGNTVSVTGFDYSANWCGSHTDADGNITYGGQKLIVEFKIRPTDAFLGGNGVQTNVGTDDGIYASSEAGKEPVEKFAPQRVDVPVKAVEPVTTNTEIYLGEKTNMQDRITTDVSQLDEVNNKYVNVTYTVKDENGGTVGTYTVPAGSSSGTWVWPNGSEVQPDKTTTYTVTCTVSPTQTGTYGVVEKTANFTITVNTCSLKISKAVTGDGANPNQTFVFNVKDSAGNLVTTIVLKDGGSKTITGLAVGTYTVTEDTNWSWSYSIVGDNNKQAALSSTTPSGTVAVTNNYNSHNWLTSIADVINTWISGSAAQKN